MKLKAIAALSAAVVVLAGVAVYGTLADAVTAEVRLTFTTSTWSGGGTTTVKVTNRTTMPMSGWRVSFAWPSSPTTTWNGLERSYRAGVLTVGNESYNATIPAGGTVSFGFTSMFAGAPPIPSTCRARTDGVRRTCVVAAGSTATTTTTTGSTATTTTTAPPTTSTTVQPPTTTAPAATTTTVSTSTTLPGSTPPPLLAPYVDMANWPVPQLTAMASASGLRAFSLGFVTAASPCVPAWGGYPSLAVSASGAGTQIQAIHDSIAAATAAGHRVVPSFGGVAGTELAQSCTTVAALTDAYRSVVVRYGSTRIDLDIEGAAQGDHAANARRAQALAALQRERAAAGTPLAVSLTLPVLPTGLTADGLGVLTDTLAGGVQIATVNVMAMDYGWPVADMGQAAIDAATATAAQLAKPFPSLTAAQRRAMVGITPMIGLNDVPGETFTVTDAQKVASWARANGIGMLGYWSVQRDGPCANNASILSDHCSGMPDPLWAYAHAFGA